MRRLWEAIVPDIAFVRFGRTVDGELDPWADDIDWLAHQPVWMIDWLVRP